jgi:hypothetical protein
LERQRVATIRAVADLSDRAEAGIFAIPGGWPRFRGEAWTGGGVNDALVRHVSVLKLSCASYVLFLFFLLSCLFLSFRRTLIFHRNRGSTWLSPVRDSRMAIFVFGPGFDLRWSCGSEGHCKRFRICWGLKRRREDERKMVCDKFFDKLNKADKRTATFDLVNYPILPGWHLIEISNS